MIPERVRKQEIYGLFTALIILLARFYQLAKWGPQASSLQLPSFCTFQDSLVSIVVGIVFDGN